jgi:hypothetical protein
METGLQYSCAVTQTSRPTCSPAATKPSGGPFDYLPADRLGLADTVLVLDILGVGIEQMSSADDFASFFVGDQPDMKLRDGA